MTLETDDAARARANARGEPLATKAESGAAPAPRPICTIFFVYMRLNQDGTFAAYHYFYRGVANTPIDPSLDPDILHSLGWFVRDMALYSRPSAVRNHRYEHLRKGLSDIKFPRHYSYCVFFMDDLHWKYLARSPGVPTINFHAEKEGRHYAVHPYAFVNPVLMNVEMPIHMSADKDVRQAAIMTNLMHNADNKELEKDQTESFCFDLWMRVRYAGSTDGLTLIIDPTGDNLGPPDSP